jgi:hypothetical protein
MIVHQQRRVGLNFDDKNIDPILQTSLLAISAAGPGGA